MGSLLDK